MRTLAFTLTGILSDRRPKQGTPAPAKQTDKGEGGPAGTSRDCPNSHLTPSLCHCMTHGQTPPLLLPKKMGPGVMTGGVQGAIKAA